MAKKESVSVFFPAYNDSATIGKLAADAVALLRKEKRDFEIIIVNDGSRDDTPKIIDGLAKKYPEVKAIHHKKNRGYGGALKTGFENARKDLIFYTDGDGQYDVKELKILLDNLGGFDGVNGYKIKRNDAAYRIILGDIYRRFVKFFFALKLMDIDCDFRLFKRKIFDKVKLESNTGVICVEMVKKIEAGGYKIKEVPVHHYPRISGNSQFFIPRRLFQVFKSLFWLWVELVLKPAFSGKKA
ncbi:MAG: glycosyltransferase family 2 protein [Candidatus ainarchaeum sp.]|nr:glycosyltransferase family 2 protein [Candidatus ainarchaeum sp.]